MAVHRSLGGRDPLSYPRLENDDCFIGKRELQKFPFSKDAQSAQSDQPFKRLFNTNTLSSSRHQVFNVDPEAPNDSLDFLLKVKYDQHNDLLKPLAVTRYQKETFDKDHGRVLKNREEVVIVPPPPLNHPLRINCQPERERLEQAKLGIDANHTILTNSGYSRKPDGGHFTS